MPVRNQLFIICLCIAAFSACKKQAGTEGDSSCISQMPGLVNQPSLGAADAAAVSALFSANHLDSRLHHFTNYTPDDNPGSGLPVQTEVNATPVINGLPVFDAFESFVFINGLLDTAYLGTAKPANNDSSGHQTLANLRSAFRDHLSESKIYSSIGTGNTYTAQELKDSCLRATLGYLDAASRPDSKMVSGRTLIKVWAVTLSDNLFPEVYVNDQTGDAWGVVFFYP